MVDKNILNRVAQLEAARPAYEEPPRITADMDAATAMKVYRQTLNWPQPPAKPLTPEEQDRLDRMTPEEATRIYRASIGLPPEDEPAPAPVVEPDPEAMTPEEATQIYRESLLKEPDDSGLVNLSADEATQRYRELLDPLAWLDDADRWQADHPGELHADRNGPPTSDEYPPQETATDEQPEPTPQAVAVPQNDDDSSWVLM